MKLSAIVAVSDNHVIGDHGRIPWRLPADQDLAKKITMGQPLVMGSKTHDAIGRVLPGRTNIVISRRPDYKASEGAIVVSSIDKALSLKEVKDSDEVFIFGGQKIYELAMARLEKIYLTRVHVTVKGDAYFKYDPAKWQETSRESHLTDPYNQYDYDFITLELK